MNYLVWFFVVALLGHLAWCVFQAMRDARRNWKLEHRIAEIGHEQTCQARNEETWR